MRLLALLALPLLVAGCGGGEKNPGVRSASGLTARFTPVPNPPHVGLDSDFAVDLSQNGAPVTGARVGLALFYRAMNQAGPTATFNETAPGHYEATGLTTGMNGKWEAEVTVARDRQPDVKLTFPFTVAK